MNIASMAIRGEAGQNQIYILAMAKKYYQMLWDCEYCGATKLLAKDQKLCPTCGGLQNPAKRYFPDMSEAREVVGHVVKGVDRICGACGKVSPIEAEICLSCGASMVGAQEVVRKEYLDAKTMDELSARNIRLLGQILGGGAVLVFIALVFIFAIYPALDKGLGNNHGFLVEERIWHTHVKIEEYGLQTQCALPWSEETFFVIAPNYEPIQVAQSDEGDGTFSVNDGGGGDYGGGGDNGGGGGGSPWMKCRKPYHDWAFSHTFSKSGNTMPIVWPDVRLSSNQRVTQRYTVWRLELSEVGTTRSESCEVSERFWQASPPGSPFVMRRGFFTKKAFCEKLRAVK